MKQSTESVDVVCRQHLPPDLCVRSLIMIRGYVFRPIEFPFLPSEQGKQIDEIEWSIDHKGDDEKNDTVRGQIADAFMSHRQLALELLGFIVNEDFNNALTEEVKLIELIDIILIIRFLGMIVFLFDL